MEVYFVYVLKQFNLIFLQKFEAYDSKGAIVAGDKNKEVGYIEL